MSISPIQGPWRSIRTLLAVGSIPLTLALLAGGAFADVAALANRYPYDPACSWGRLADGRGMWLRCLTQEEAKRLATPAPTTTTPTPAPSGSVDPGDKGDGDGAEPAKPSKVLVELAEPTPSGQLPAALKSLAKAKGKIAECFADKPKRLKAETGEVTVRFLVRARGRVEGISVAGRKNVTKKGATCIADVLDRRLVGSPKASNVEAQLVITVKRAP